MVNVGRNMNCVYTNDVEGILEFKTTEVLKKSKFHVRQLIINRNKYYSEINDFICTFNHLYHT
jgi:hypothetical protein